MPNISHCREWPNCECPRCERYRYKLEQRRSRVYPEGQPLKVIGECHYCGGKATTRDHIVPRSKGGKNGNGNIVPACYQCNKRKGSMDYREFCEMIGKKV